MPIEGQRCGNDSRTGGGQTLGTVFSSYLERCLQAILNLLMQEAERTTKMKINDQCLSVADLLKCSSWKCMYTKKADFQN